MPASIEAYANGLGVFPNGDAVADVNFVAHDTPRPRRLMFDGPYLRPTDVEIPAKVDTQRVDIVNGRDKNLNLVDNGLQLVPQPTKMTNEDFYDNEKIQGVFYPECEAAIKKHLPGASRVVIFDHNVRGNKKASEKATLKGGSAERVREPVLFAHNDYTEISAPRRIEELSRTKEEGGSSTSEEVIFDPSEVPELQNKRYIYLNVWRNIADYPVKDFPLAVCDGQSVERDDLIKMTLVYADREGEVFMMKHRKGQKWFYFPEMRNDEAMLLKCFDSEDNSGRWTGHSAFNAHPPEGTFQTRQSIEVRTIVFFD